MLSVSGKVVLVTGASSGLGLHFTRTLAKGGAKVAVAARRMDRLEALVAELKQGGAVDVVAVAMDVCDQQSVKDAVSQATRALGPITVLVNNAGMAVDKPALRHTREDWDKVVDTNLTGPFLVAQAVAREMVRAKTGGSIINIASVAGLAATLSLSAYCASKAGLVHLTRTLALEWARHGVRVNAICPGYFKTDMNRSFFDSGKGDKLIRKIPMQRLGEPEELDGLLLLMASEGGSYMTGSIVSLDGGMLVSNL